MLEAGWKRMLLTAAMSAAGLSLACSSEPRTDAERLARAARLSSG
jgi:hypothetical protein